MLLSILMFIIIIVGYYAIDSNQKRNKEIEEINKCWNIDNKLEEK